MITREHYEILKRYLSGYFYDEDPDLFAMQFERLKDVYEACMRLDRSTPLRQDWDRVKEAMELFLADATAEEMEKLVEYVFNLGRSTENGREFVQRLYDRIFIDPTSAHLPPAPQPSMPADAPKKGQYKIADWRQLTDAERNELEAQLTPVLEDEKAFVQKLIDLGYPPPGTLVFRADGGTDHVPDYPAGIERISGVIAIQAYIRSLEKYAQNPHTLERHGPYIKDEVLRNWDLGDSEPPTRFVRIVDVNKTVQEATLAKHRAEIKTNCENKKLGLEDFTGPTVEYEGWSEAGIVKGTTSTIVRLYFDGKGNWGLESAFPNPQ